MHSTTTSLFFLASFFAITLSSPLPVPQNIGDVTFVEEIADFAVPSGYMLVPSSSVVELLGIDTKLSDPSLVFLSNNPKESNGELGIVKDITAPSNFLINPVFVTFDEKHGKLPLSKGTKFFKNRNGAGNVFLSNKLLTYGTPSEDTREGYFVEDTGFELKTYGEKKLLGRSGHFKEAWTACRVGGKEFEGKNARFTVRWIGAGGLSDMGECIGKFELEALEATDARGEKVEVVVE